MSDWSDWYRHTMTVTRPGGAVDVLGSRVDVPAPVVTGVACRFVDSRRRVHEQGRDREADEHYVFADLPLDVRPGDYVDVDGERYVVMDLADQGGEGEVVRLTVRRQ